MMSSGQREKELNVYVKIILLNLIFSPTPTIFINKAKYLVVYVDNNLFMDSNISHIC